MFPSLLLLISIFLVGPHHCNAFLQRPTGSRCARLSRLFLSDDVPLLGESVATPAEDFEIFQSLRQRQNALENGIGKRYVCRTQNGFLNVHYEPGDPFCVDNIVALLHDGDIVTSTGPPRGAWVPHDKGGWSIAIYNGFKWLEPLNE